MTRRPPQSEFYIAPFIIHCVCQENYCGPFNITSRVAQTELQIGVVNKFAGSRDLTLAISTRVSSRQTNLIRC